MKPTKTDQIIQEVLIREFNQQAEKRRINPGDRTTWGGRNKDASLAY